MDTWAMAFKVAAVGISAVFAGLLMLAGGVKIMSFFCRLATRKQKEESNPDSAM